MALAGPAPSDEKADVRAMFTTIAPRYDVLNRLLSLGIDRRWRLQAARAALHGGAARVLDVATGTGDLAFTMAELSPSCEITGVDFAEAMLDLARAKGLGRSPSSPRVRVRFEVGDGTALRFDADGFDAVTIAYGLRNFDDVDAGLREFLRVLRPGGRLVVLEFPPPPGGAFGLAYRLYFTRVLPAIGGLVSGRAAAYRYLPASVLAFPAPDRLAERMRSAGFVNVRYRLQTFGISAIHLGEKPA